MTAPGGKRKTFACVGASVLRLDDVQSLMTRDDDLWTRFESHCHNEGLTESRIHKLRTMFNMVERGMNAPLDEADESDIRDFVNRLHRDDFEKKHGGGYSGSTKSDAKKFLKQFYKWMEGEHGQYPEKVVWLSTKIPKDEKPERTRFDFDDLHKIAARMNTAMYTAMAYILYDSGFRAQELLSARKEDLSMKAYDDGDECWWIACRESKTQTREVPIPLFTDEVNRFTNSGYYKSRDKKERLFDVSYRTALNTIKKHSEAVLGEHVTFHNFRHSSATYWADHLTKYELCDRFGWGYDSEQAERYVKKSSRRQRQAAQKAVENQVTDMENRVDELEEKNEELRERLSKLEDLMDTVTK